MPIDILLIFTLAMIYHGMHSIIDDTNLFSVVLHGQTQPRLDNWGVIQAGKWLWL